MSNLAQCYINLGLYEDALRYANNALNFDLHHSKTWYRKAKCLAFLSQFGESINIFRKLEKVEEVEIVKM